MDVDAPILIEEILRIIERHAGLSAYRLDYLRKIREIKDVSILHSLKKILCFLDEKNLLDQHLDFIIENKHYINQLSIFLNWLKEINASPSELLDSLKQFADVSDIDKVIACLGELEARSILDGQIDFTFFSGLVDLINEDMAEEKYIDLIRNVENTPTLLKALKILKRNDLLQDPYYEFVFDREAFFPVIKAELISGLKKNNALSEQNFNVCRENTDLILLLEVAKILERNAISLQDNFLPLAAKNIHALLSFLNYLEKKSLVTKEQITAIKRASDNTLKYLIHIVSLADEVASPTELSLLIVENSEKLRKLSKSLMLLKNENYLTLENYKLVSTNLHYPDIVFQFSQALVVLRNNQLDDIRWKNEAYNSEHPLQLVFLFKELNKAGILSDTNLALLKKITMPNCFLRLLRVLNRLHSLTEENFEKLIRLDRVLASSYLIYEKLSRMKSISLELLSEVFLISAEDLDKTTKLEKIEQLLEREEGASLNKPRLSINREQSTHVSSVQFSISQSAKHFLQKYGEKITASNLDKNFLEITDELKTLASDNNVKNRAALNALEKIISQSDYIEPISKLNLRELLVLLWEGINDDSQRISSLLDAKVQIIEGLYEIQRGGNIDAFGQDNGLPDEAICCTGAFNKLVEKMVGVHQFAEVINITPELAATKFPLVVKAKAVDYLISLDHERLLLTYDLLKEEGIPFIWKHIASNVQEAILAEFSPLYQLESGDVTEDFKRLMASHQDLDIDEQLLASVKSAYALRKLEFATSATTFSDCGEISGVKQQLKRSINDCVKKNAEKERRYRPFSALHREFEYALSFFMGRVESDLEKIVVEKIEILQKMAKDRYLSIRAFDDFASASLEGVCEVWLIAERFLKEGKDITESNLIEFSFGEKKYYITIKPSLHRVGSYRVYCSTFNKELFLELNSDVDVEETIEIFKEILYPDVPLYQIKTRYLSYFQPEGYLLISSFQELFFSSLEKLKTELHDFEGVPRKGFYEFFLINGKLPTEDNVDFLFKHGLELEFAKLSFILEKTPEVLSYFSEQEQIALGKLLSKYPIPMKETQSVLMGSELNKFHKDLLLLLIDCSNKNEVISEKKLNKLAREICFSVLSKADLGSEEANGLLESLVQSHTQVKVKLENLVGPSRLSILVAPALIKALNGHSDNLIHLAGMMGGDHLINESYLNLIKHEGFSRRFPKLSTILQKGQYALASPICKLLLLTSFYELTKQLLNTASNTPEYKMAQSLLVDNTILFSALFAEAFGLALGPAGIILDLGITIHQLLIASDYIRQHYHLQVSLWEGIKFELGFNGIVSEILESREIVRLNLISINNLSKSAKYYFSNVVLKGPKVVEIEAKKVERKELPDFLLKKIYLSPLTDITSLKYLYKVDTRMGRLQSYTTVSYLKRQILIESIQGIFINFSEKNISLPQENNIFFKFEKQCTSSFTPLYLGDKCSIFDFFGSSYCMEKKCITTNRILTEGWGVASSTTISDRRIGRIENMHSLTISGDVGAMLENTNAFNQDQVWIKVLILFNPLFGNMTVEDGSFLKNKTLVVLIQDPVLADIIVNDRMQSISDFNFTSFDYLNQLHYWVGFNSIPSIIEDNFDCLSIYLMPLSLDDPEQTITMLSNSQLIVGEKGPRFVGLENKREIIIYFKRGYPLYGYFDFISPIIKLHTPTVKSKEIAIFGLEAYQICLLENIQGAYIFYSRDMIEIGHEIIIQVTRFEVNTNVTKQLNNAYFIESDQLLNFLIVNYYAFAWLSYNITELNVSWCEIDCALIKVRSKVSEFLDLTFKGRFQLADKNCTAWFSFKAEKMGCNFFDLNGTDLLLENFASFKELLEKGYTSFNFSKRGYLNDKLEYNSHEKKIIYKKIQYRLDEDYPFVAIIGDLTNSSVYTESFENLLPNIVIDLRNEDQPVRVASNTLQIGDRLLTEVATTALLLTKLGKQYMGLLPIFTPSEGRAANLQVNTQEINESGYLPRLSKRSKDTSDSQLTNWSKGFIVLGSLFTFFILTKTIIFCRRRMNTSPGIIEMGVIGAAIGVPLLSPTVQSLNDNGYLLPASRDYFEQNYKDSNQYFNQGFRGEKSNSFKEAIVFGFEKLPKNIIFLQWGIGLYKKLNKPKNIFLESSFEELLVILAKELTKLSYHQAITTNQKKILNHLLTSIHRLSFLIKPNTSCVFIIKEADFIVWNDVIRDLFVFERSFKHYFEKGRVRTITKVMDRLDTMSIEVNHGFSNCLDYLAAIERLLKMLASSANTLNLRHCHAFDLPDSQWLIRRLNVLQDALADLKSSRKLSFSEFKYYLSEVLPEAKRLASCLENKYFAIDFSSYLNLVAAMKRDCSEGVLFQNSNISKASNTSLAMRSHLAKKSFFTLNKRAVNIADVDYAVNDRNRVDFSARNSNLRNTFHRLG
ncbi:MAG: hypothetical protein V4471_06025 [Pseudomonadota bacterium]